MKYLVGLLVFAVVVQAHEAEDSILNSDEISTVIENNCSSNLGMSDIHHYYTKSRPKFIMFIKCIYTGVQLYGDQNGFNVTRIMAHRNVNSSVLVPQSTVFILYNVLKVCVAYNPNGPADERVNKTFECILDFLTPVESRDEAAVLSFRSTVDKCLSDLGISEKKSRNVRNFHLKLPKLMRCTFTRLTIFDEQNGFNLSNVAKHLVRLTPEPLWLITIGCIAENLSGPAEEKANKTFECIADGL